MEARRKPAGFGRRTKIVLAAVLAGLVITIPLILVLQSIVPFVSVAEALESSGGETIALKGKLVPNSYVRSPDAQTVTFRIRDEEGGNGEVISVNYGGEITSNLFFNDHAVLNVFGSVDKNGVIQAETLNIKCPSKYISEEERNNDGTFDSYYQSDADSTSP